MAKKNERTVVTPPITDVEAKMKALETTMGRITIALAGATHERQCEA